MAETDAPGFPPNAPRVLVVDDSPSTRRFIGEILEGAGLRCETAADGEQAFRRVIENPPMLVVCDVSMPGISGIQFCRLLKSDRETRNLPILLMTASGDRRGRFWAERAGADGYLIKEQMTDTLLAEVGRFVGPAASEQAVSRPSVMVAGSTASERIGQLLDRLLFDATVAGEVRRLAAEVHSREALARAFLGLVQDLIDAPIQAVLLDGPSGRDLFVAGTDPLDDASLRSVALAGWTPGGALDPAKTPIHLLTEKRTDSTGSVQLTYVRAVVPAGEESPSAIAVLTHAPRRPSGGDLATIEVLAKELSTVLRILFLYERVHQASIVDAVTGLYNRRYAVETLGREILRAGRYKTALSVMIADIDHFKRINDTWGHNTGDVVLRETAQTLRRGVRSVDLVCRWGGEEFLVLLPQTGAAGARIAAERLRLAVEKTPIVMPDRSVHITTSLGVATLIEGMTEIDDLVELADRALYDAKDRGRNRVEVAAGPPE